MGSRFAMERCNSMVLCEEDGLVAVWANIIIPDLNKVENDNAILILFRTLLFTV